VRHAVEPLELLGRHVGERRADRARADHRLDLGGRAVGDDDASRHEDRAVGELVRLLAVVRREEHRLAVRGGVAHRPPERSPALDVHAHGGLVEDEELRIREEREREAHALRLASGELLRPLVCDVRDADELDRGVEVERLRVERRDLRQQLANGWRPSRRARW
jgi:hypothetical protein